MIFPVWEKCKSKPSSGQWLREPGEGVGEAGGGGRFAGHPALRERVSSQSGAGWGGCLQQKAWHVQRPGETKARDWSGNTWPHSRREPCRQRAGDGQRAGCAWNAMALLPLPLPPGVVLVLRAPGVASSHITEGCRKVSNATRSKVFGVAWKVPATSEPRWPERALGAS